MEILIKKGICGWQSNNNLVLFPGGGKLSADDDLIEKMSGQKYISPGSDKELTDSEFKDYGYEDYKSTGYK